MSSYTITNPALNLKQVFILQKLRSGGYCDPNEIEEILLNLTHDQ